MYRIQKDWYRKKEIERERDIYNIYRGKESERKRASERKRKVRSKESVSNWMAKTDNNRPRNFKSRDKKVYLEGVVFCVYSCKENRLLPVGQSPQQNVMFFFLPNTNYYVFVAITYVLLFHWCVSCLHLSMKITSNVVTWRQYCWT